MNLSVALLMPVYNEERTLGKVLDSILGLSRVQRCIVVDDGSTDKSRNILKDRLEKSGGSLRVITHPQNRGKGAAIQSGLSIADSDFVVIHDADQEYQITDLDVIFDLLEKRESDVVFGSRFLKRNPNFYLTYLWGNKLLTAFVNALGHGSLTDSYTAIKGMSTEKWRSLKLESNGFEIEAEISMKCLLAGWKITEAPVSYSPRTFDQGKKIRSSDAVKGLLKALQCRLFRA